MPAFSDPNCALLPNEALAEASDDGPAAAVVVVVVVIRCPCVAALRCRRIRVPDSLVPTSAPFVVQYVASLSNPSDGAPQQRTSDVVACLRPPHEGRLSTLWLGCSSGVCQGAPEQVRKVYSDVEIDWETWRSAEIDRYLTQFTSVD